MGVIEGGDDDHDVMLLQLDCDADDGRKNY